MPLSLSKMGMEEGWGKEKGERKANAWASSVQQGLGQGLNKHFLSESHAAGVVIVEMGKQRLKERAA